MMRLTGLLACVATFVLAAGDAHAQGIPNSATVVTACGNVSPQPPYTPGQIRATTTDPNGEACTNTSVSFPNPVNANITGGTVAVTGGPVSVTGSVTATVSGPVTATPTIATTTDQSGTVTVGGTFQTVATSSPTRLSLEADNICNVAAQCSSTFDYCYVSFASSPTKSNSVPIPPGGSYLRASGVIPSDAMKITCDTTGDKYRATVQ
jgi:hypothetical protein